MRIAEIAPAVLSVPPRGYGGTERVVSLLVEALVGRGHDVTLFASGDSRTTARLESVVNEATGMHRPGFLGDELYHEASAFLRADEFDIVHDHSWFGAYFGAFMGSLMPVVVTLHLPWWDDGRRAHRLIGDRIHRVAISDHQRRSNPEVSYAGMIHHGIDLNRHPFRTDKEDYLLFLGRTVREKGPELAVEVAKRSGRHLKMVIKREEYSELEHWERVVAPALRGDEEVIEGATHQEKVNYLGRAAGLLFPIQWPEPFGLVMVEAMACGTPVIALAEGAAPEVLADGVTGFLASSLDEMVEAVARLRHISPHACRERVARWFSVENMAIRYEELFRSITGRARV